MEAERQPRTAARPGSVCSQQSTAASSVTASAFFSTGSTQPLARSGLSRLSALQLSKKPTSAFLRTDRSKNLEDELTFSWQSKIIAVLNNSVMETIIGGVVLFTIGLIIVDTDSRADLPGRGTSLPPPWTGPLLGVSFGIFTLEVVARIFAEQRRYLSSTSNRLDLVVFFAGAFEYVISWAGSSAANLNTFRIIRLCRLLRVLRLVRLFEALQELAWLLQMIASCIKTVFWSFILLVLIMTVWAILAVEAINPLVQEMAYESAWSDCERCHRAFSSVFLANLTLFQTIVAGDSWGLMALPLMENHAWTGIIFVGSLMTLVFGVLNLIVAVVIDAYAKERAGNIMHIAEELDSDEVKEKRDLARMFSLIDKNGNGTLTLEELKDGALTVDGFSQWLRVLDIDAEDLGVLFEMVDRDASGFIGATQFIEAMYRFKNTEPKTATRFVKHIVATMCDGQHQTVAKLDLGLRQAQLHRKEVEELIRGTRAAQKKLQQQADGIQAALDAVLRGAVVATTEEVVAETKSTLARGLSASIADEELGTLELPQSKIRAPSPDFKEACCPQGVGPLKPLDLDPVSSFGTSRLEGLLSTSKAAQSPARSPLLSPRVLPTPPEAPQGPAMQGSPGALPSRLEAERTPEWNSAGSALPPRLAQPPALEAPSKPLDLDPVAFAEPPSLHRLDGTLLSAS